MLRPGGVIAVCVVALLTLGVVMVNSAGMSLDPTRPVTVAGLLTSRPLIYMALALVAMLAAARLTPLRLLALASAPDPSRPSGWQLSRLWIGVLGLSAVLALVYLPGVGSAKKGSHRWLNVPLPGLGDLSVQPSEIAKWGLVVLVACAAAKLGARLRSFWHGLMPALVAVGLVSGLVILEDLGTGVLIGLVAVTLLLAAGARWWHLALFVPAGVAAFAAAVIAEPYRMGRLVTFLDPYKEPQGAGYHMIQSMVAVANGEVFGRGLGHGLQKFGYLPEDTTDFLFAIICEELGVAGAGVVVALYAGLMAAGYLVIRKQPTLVCKLLALGVIATVSLQAVINIAVVTALAPTKGIALPLLSSGGTGWILTAAALGSLMAMDRAADRAWAARVWAGGAAEGPLIVPVDPAPSPLPATPRGPERHPGRAAGPRRALA